MSTICLSFVYHLSIRCIYQVRFCEEFVMAESLSFDPIRFFLKGIKYAFGGLFALYIIFAVVNVVDEGEKAVILTFGEISDTWDPGLHVKLPLVQSIETYSLRVQKATFGESNYPHGEDEDILTAYSNDQQIIESYALSMTWSYDGNRVADVYKHFGSDRSGAVFNSVVRPTVVQVTKAILGQYTAQTIVQERAKLDTAIEDSLKKQLANLPINILSVQFEDVSFSEKYEEVLEQTAQKKMEIEKAHHLLDGGLFFCLMVYMVTRVLWVRPFSFSSFIDGIIYFY